MDEWWKNERQKWHSDSKTEFWVSASKAKCMFQLHEENPKTAAFSLTWHTHVLKQDWNSFGWQGKCISKITLNISHLPLLFVSIFSPPSFHLMVLSPAFISHMLFSGPLLTSTFPGLNFQPHLWLIAPNVFCIELQSCSLVAVRVKAADV